MDDQDETSPDMAQGSPDILTAILPDGRHTVQPNVPPLSVGFEWYEPAVNMLVRDFLHQGDVFFDVGANLGGISLAGSRAVGPAGKVAAFEVSPRIIPQLIANLQSWHATNVSIVPHAAWSSSGQLIDLYFGAADHTDSVMKGRLERTPNHVATTIRLDDIAAGFDKAPALVKLDIEGAEHEALKGFEHTLQKARPTLILEMQESDAVLAAWLEERGYALFLADAYEPFAPTDDGRLINTLAIHRSHREALAAFRNLKQAEIASFCASDWREDVESPYLILGDLPAGRYRLDLTPQAGWETDEIITELAIAATPAFKPLSVHIAPWSHLARSYTMHPLSLDRPATVILRVKGRPLGDLDGMLAKASLRQISNTRDGRFSVEPRRF